MKPKLKVRFNLFLLGTACLLLPFSSFAQYVDTEDEAPPAIQTELAKEIFSIFSPAIVQVRVVTKNSQVKAAVGSGFFVQESSHIVTNFHVIHKFVVDPKQYAIEVVNNRGESYPATLRAIDVVNDLAVLAPIDKMPKTTTVIPTHVVTPSQGTHIFALGNPLDLGQTVIEGTYSGLIASSPYKRIHFSGSLNSGMSGGPCVDSAGNLIGVNVASAGDEVSFLVPADKVKALLVQAAGREGSEHFRSQMIQQLTRNQDVLTKEILRNKTKAANLGNYVVPTELIEKIRCWSDSRPDEGGRYQESYLTCSTEDGIFLSEDFNTGEVTIYHWLIEGRTVNSFQLNEMVSKRIRYPYAQFNGSQEDVTNFNCGWKYVETNGLQLQVHICLRAYKKILGLYDLHMTTISMNEPKTVLVSSLSVAGLVFENANAVIDHVLKELKWRSM